MQLDEDWILQSEYIQRNIEGFFYQIVLKDFEPAV